MTKEEQIVSHWQSEFTLHCRLKNWQENDGNFTLSTHEGKNPAYQRALLSYQMDVYQKH